MKRLLGLFFIVCLVAPSLSGVARAQGVSLIRDAEIERYIRAYATPIWEVAGLDPTAVRIHLVNDKSLNAFVAGGQRIFVFTGLILASADPTQIIGVLAHETGHITGGHLARFQDGLKGATTISILSLILGAAAIAAGQGDAGAAILTSSGEFATRSFLTYSRTQEASADQAGLSFLTASGQSGHGLIGFFEYLGDQEALLTTNKDPYVRSHPLTEDRVARLRELARASPHWNKPASPEFVDMLARTKAKLHGFLTHPSRVFRLYPIGKPSRYGAYARAVAYHRQGFTEKAVAEVDLLIARLPADPYFHELKGQILFESGKVRESIEPYRQAVRYGPDEPLLRVSLAQSILATEDPKLTAEAVENLEVANRYEGNNSFSWHQLALAYNSQGNEAMAALATAERYAIIGHAPDALKQAKFAVKNLEPETPQWYRAQDLLLLSRNAVEDSYRRRGKEPPKPKKDGEKGEKGEDTGKAPDDAEKEPDHDH